MTFQLEQISFPYCEFRVIHLYVPFTQINHPIFFFDKKNYIQLWTILLSMSDPQS